MSKYEVAVIRNTIIIDIFYSGGNKVAFIISKRFKVIIMRNGFTTIKDLAK